MKPRFALTFPEDGIALLHRTKGGWSTVGEVRLDDPDIEETLKMLRGTASGLESGGVRSQLVIPDSQILYTSLPIGAGADDTWEAEIRAGLDGLTPYEVDELVFDWEPDGETARVAAVARETLEEAEAFATRHRFNPLCFVADPGDGEFPRKPWFGATDAAARLIPEGETLEREGNHPKTENDRADSAPETAADAMAPAFAEAQPVTASSLLKGEPRNEPAPEKHPMRETGAASDLSAPLTLHPARVGGDQASSALAPQGRATFLTRRSGAAAPHPAPLHAPARSRLTFVDTSLQDAPKLGAAERTVGVTAAAAPLLEPEAPPPAPEPPTPKPKPAMPGKARSGRRKSRKARGTKGKSAQKASALPKVEIQPATATPIAPPPANEEEALTVFGARKSQDTTGRSRYLGLALTVALLLVMAAAALWAAMSMTREVSLPPQDVSDRTATLAAPEIAPPPEFQAESGGDPDVETAALPAMQPPQDADTPDIAGTDPAAPARTAQPESTTTADAAPDTPTVADPEAVANAEMAAEPEPAPAAPVTPETARAFYAEAGIWPLAPSVPGAPDQDRIGDIHVASIDSAIPGEDAVALPPADKLTGDISLPEQGVPPEPGQVFKLDERGLVTPSTDGTLSPEGNLIFSGKPPAVPPPRPQDEAGATPAEDAAAQAERTRLAALAPRPRPESVAKQAADAPPDAAKDEAAPKGPLVVASSLMPAKRPADFSSVVAEALKQAQSTPAAAPASVRPSVPTEASVAKQATLKNVINLRELNLIGVYGAPSNRRALVRLPSGRYEKVQVGDRLDGGRIAAIGEDKLRYVKNGRSIILEIPGNS